MAEQVLGDAGAPADAAVVVRAPDFETLFENESGYVWNTLRHLGVAAADLEDLTHDVLLAVYRRLPDFDPTREVRPWLFGIALRVAAHYRRRAHRRMEVRGAELAEPADRGPLPDEHAALREAERIAERALEAVAMDRRPIFLLHEIDGCAMPEIARSLGIPVNTAYSRLRLARADFFRAVAELSGLSGLPGKKGARK